jgi:hypothetical protein
MTKADSVHSTPRTDSSSIQDANSLPEAHGESVDSFSQPAAIGQPESGNLARESGRPARGLSRRAALAGLAILPAAMPAAAAEPDPVYAAIERYKELSVEYTAAVDRSAPLHPKDPGYRDARDDTFDAGDALFEQMDVLFTLRPSTLAGAVTWLKYISTLEDWQMPAGLEDGDGKANAQAFCVALAGALEQIGGVA